MQYLSESFLQMAGRTTEQAQGNGWMGALAPETAEQTRRDWSTAVDTKTPWNLPRDDGPGAEFGFRVQPLTPDAV